MTEPKAMRPTRPTPAPMPALAPVDRALPEAGVVVFFASAGVVELEKGFEPGAHPRKFGIVMFTLWQRFELKVTAFFWSSGEHLVSRQHAKTLTYWTLLQRHLMSMAEQPP